MGRKDFKIMVILKELEEYREKLHTGELRPGCPDHTIRLCEAIVARYGPFENRAEWVQAISDLRL